MRFKQDASEASVRAHSVDHLGWSACRARMCEHRARRQMGTARSHVCRTDDCGPGYGVDRIPGRQNAESLTAEPTWEHYCELRAV
eukprot:COSAG06_NODE_7921_length_2333_cov_2.379141_1_plen_85_part_00